MGSTFLFFVHEIKRISLYFLLFDRSIKLPRLLKLNLMNPFHFWRLKHTGQFLRGQKSATLPHFFPPFKLKICLVLLKCLVYCTWGQLLNFPFFPRQNSQWWRNLRKGSGTFCKFFCNFVKSYSEARTRTSQVAGHYTYHYTKQTAYCCGKNNSFYH